MRALSAYLLLYLVGVYLPFSTAFAQEGKPLVASESRAEPEWQELAPDLQMFEAVTGNSGIFSASLLLLRTGLKNFRVKAVRVRDYGQERGTAKQIANLAGATLAVNANFFDPEGNALGLVVSRGISLNPIHRGGKVLTGIFQVGDRGPSIIPRQAFTPHGVIEAVQAGPRLITSGKAVSGLREDEIASRRAGVCVDGAGRLLIFCSRSALGGITMNELQTILLNPKIGCVDALNLDGGGSAQLYFGVKDKSGKMKVEEFLPGRDPVPIALVLQSIED